MSAIVRAALAAALALARTMAGAALMELGGVKAATPTPSPAEVGKAYAEGIEQFRTLARIAGLQARSTGRHACAAASHPAGR